MFGDIGKCKFVSSSGALRLQGWTRERSALVVVCTEVLVVRGGGLIKLAPLDGGLRVRVVSCIQIRNLNAKATLSLFLTNVGIEFIAPHPSLVPLTLV